MTPKIVQPAMFTMTKPELKKQFTSITLASLTYDSQGRVKPETNELNQTTTYEYDAYSKIKAVINALNERTEFEYDKRRNLINSSYRCTQSQHPL